MQRIELANSKGMKVLLVDYGARIASILVPCNDELLEMTVTPNNKALLERDPFYLGATCGPVCNRISNASFSLNGDEYQLTKNDGHNCLHGGESNISLRYWEIHDQSDMHVIFKLRLVHLEDGFPGNRDLYVRYYLSDDNALNIQFNVISDIDTPINLTNHAYFNLGEQNIEDLIFKLNAKELLERKCNGLPTGRLLNTTETGFDMYSWVRVKDFIEGNQYEQIIVEEGIDHCFVLDDSETKASLQSLSTGIRLDISTDQPAIQFYTGKFLSNPYKPYQGLCFECQGFTDAVNHSNFPSTILNKESEYSQFITYRFTQRC